MVSSILGNYLVDKGVLTKEQFDNVIAEKKKVRVKLGLIAVAEGLMTAEEAEVVNMLQTAMDKRFGDIAVEKGYLNEGQVETLLKKQGNGYLAFAQAMENLQIMTLEQLADHMANFQQENNFTASDMDDLKSDDVDRILPLYLDNDCQKYLDLVGTAFRTIMRCVDTDIYPGKAYVTDFCAANNGAIQYVEGEPDYICAMVGMGDALLPVASIFGREEFPEVNMDALDAIGELLNCISGLYATALSQSGVETELYPPEYSNDIKAVTSDEMLILPIHVRGKQVDLAVAIGHKIKMQ